MTDMRRTLLWVVFIMSLVLLYDGWNKHQGHPTLFGAPIGEPPASAVAGASAPGTSAPSAAGVPAAAGIGSVATPAAAAPSAPGEQVTIQTDVMKATLDTLGASVTHLELTAYKDAMDPTHPVVLFDQSATRHYQAQTGFINPAPGSALLPRHLSPFTVQPGDRALKDGANELVVRFESPEIGGAKLVKTYTFRRGDYTIGVKHELTNVSGAPITPQIYLQLLRDGNPPEGQSTSMFSSTGFTYTGPAIYTDAKKFQKVEFKDIDKRAANAAPEHEKTASDGWVAMIQHYFTSAWLLPAGTPRDFVTAKVGSDYTVAMVQPLGTLAPGATVTHQATLYAGPQDEKKLAVLEPGLELVKDYGRLTIIAKPLFWLLDQLHSLLHNWGWAIIALVVLLKIAFYWLNAAAYRSQAKMKAVNPRIMEMRERLKDKPQEMQQEMMRIYREEKINPLGGCLPIVVQMPFFISLYWVLLASVEMRGAPWLGWITDLSAKDPLFILPALMTASSMLQVWLGPKAPDPVQAKMMWLMPLMFSFMFFFFPSGLVLYWLVNNLLSIAQQWFINKRLGVA